jgi:outer membrane protein, heavy metal efflux system
MVIPPALLATAVLVLSAACAPSQRAAFAPVPVAVEARTGYPVERGAAETERLRELASGELDIDRAVRIALLTSQELQASFAEIGVGRAELVGAVVLDNPTAELEATFPTGGGDPVIELAVVQDLIGLATVGRRRRAARVRLDLTRQRAIAAAVDLVAEVQRAFLQAQAATQLVELRQTVVAAAEAGWELARRLYEAGNITRLDLVQEQAQYEEARLALERAEADLGVARARLAGVLGLDGALAEGWTVAPRLPELPEQLALDELEEDAIAASLDLEAADLEVRAAGADADVAALGWLPALGLGVAAEREPDGEWAVGPIIELSLPIFDRRQGARARSRAERAAAGARYRARTVEVRAAVRAVRIELETARARAERIRDVLLPLRQEILDQTLLQYNAMNVGLFQLLAAKREQIETGRMYIEALLDYWLAHTSVLQLRAGRVPTLADRLDRAPAASGAPAGGH